MKRLIIALALFAASFIPVAAAEVDWTKVANKLEQSIVYIEGSTGSCTGFVIDNERDHVATAAHCNNEKMYVDLAPAKIQALDTKNDLLVLKVEGIDRPALKLAKIDPFVAQIVASYGYGWGLEKPLFRVHHISQVAVQIPALSGLYIATDTTFVPGMSGGPVVNSDGDVVLMVQRGDSATGIGVPASLMEDKIGRYFTGGDKK